jgi:hypothetical protein
MIDISPLGWRNDMEVFHWMTREIGVAFDPCSSFFATEENRYIRLNFAKKLTRSIGLANDCFVSIGGWTIRCGREIDIGWRWAEVDAQIVEFDRTSMMPAVEKTLPSRPVACRLLPRIREQQCSSLDRHWVYTVIQYFSGQIGERSLITR